MRKTKLLFITIGLFFIVIQSYAQFTLSGEFRPRTEYKHGYKSLANDNTKMNLSTNQRTRLNIDYKTDSYTFFVSFQDVRVWGSENQLVSNDGAHTTLHQAYAQIKLNSKLSLKAGRQEIIYDDHRIFGSVGWAPQARSHDAAVFKYNNNGLKADLGFAFNLYPNSAAKNPKAFQYLWMHKAFGSFNASFLALNNGLKYIDSNGDESIKYSQTIGTRTGYKAGKFSAFLNLYYQGGKDNKDKKVNANLIGIDLGYKVNDKLTLGLGFEQQSGNNMKYDTVASKYVIDGDEQNAFTPFYGTNHKFNGHMDYFYVGNHIGNVGLRDIFLKLAFKKGKLGLGAQAHYFASVGSQSNVLNKEKEFGAGAPLGTEFDLSMSYPLAKGVGFKMGYSQMLGTDAMVALKGGSTDATSNWAWMMIIIKPTIFTNAK